MPKKSAKSESLTEVVQNEEVVTKTKSKKVKEEPVEVVEEAPKEATKKSRAKKSE